MTWNYQFYSQWFGHATGSTHHTPSPRRKRFVAKFVAFWWIKMLQVWTALPLNLPKTVIPLHGLAPRILESWSCLCPPSNNNGVDVGKWRVTLVPLNWRIHDSTSVTVCRPDPAYKCLDYGEWQVTIAIKPVNDLGECETVGRIVRIRDRRQITYNMETFPQNLRWRKSQHSFVWICRISITCWKSRQ